MLKKHFLCTQTQAEAFWQVNRLNVILMSEFISNSKTNANILLTCHNNLSESHSRGQMRSCCLGRKGKVFVYKIELKVRYYI